MAIIISKHGKNAKKVEKSSFEKEDYLQKYIYDNPESIPLYDIKEDIRLLIISREFSTSSGPIDALGIDKDGEMYLIETKLYKNPDKRLVMAQVLDYGASLWRSYGDFSKFIKTVEESVRKNFGVSFSQKLKDFFGLEDSDVDTLLDSLTVNFGWLNGNETIEKYRDSFKAELEKIPGITIPKDYKGKHPNFPIREWAPW